jgi:hypothetical protein
VIEETVQYCSKMLCTSSRAGVSVVILPPFNRRTEEEKNKKNIYIFTSVGLQLPPAGMN